MTSHLLLAIFGQTTNNPIVRKTAAWKAAALVTGLGIAMLAYPAHAAPTSGAIRCRVSTTRCSAR